VPPSPLQKALEAAADGGSVTLAAADAATLARLLKLLLERGPYPSDRPGKASAAPEQDPRIAAAAKFRRLRQARPNHLPPEMFGEPAFDILLALYPEDDAQPVSISLLVEATGTAMTTTLRWVEALERDRLVEREVQPSDRRTHMVRLSELGRSKMNAYLSEVLGTS
jgi:DNA-binding MarR family transcriptional regulator